MESSQGRTPVTAISPPSCLLRPSPCNWKSVRSRTFVTKLIKSSPSPRSPCRYAIPIPKQQETNCLKTMHAPGFLISIVIYNLVKYQRHFFSLQEERIINLFSDYHKILEHPHWAVLQVWILCQQNNKLFFPVSLQMTYENI